jgi:hypothetical protein
MEIFIAIDKYGCFYDPITEETCPMNRNDTPDLGGVIHVDDITCEEREDILKEISLVMQLNKDCG